MDGAGRDSVACMHRDRFWKLGGGRSALGECVEPEGQP
jgi:hypothetical protein